MMEDILQFDLPQFEPTYIKVIGVGGGGSNAVNHMCAKGIVGVDFIVCNTDRKSLDASIVPNKIQLGSDGLGAGNLPEVARKAAEAKADELKALLSNGTKMLFITAGMGGGTGTGAAPVIARIAKEVEVFGANDNMQKILTVAIVTRPFSFEGKKRLEQAEAGIAELKKYVDVVLVINNDKLREFGDLSMEEAFVQANEVLLTAAKGIAEIITVSAYVAIDFNDVNTVMADSGVALMGSGIAKGENRAFAAIEDAVSSPLLDDNDICGAKDILLYLSYNGSKGITMDEITEITAYLTTAAGKSVDVIWGYGKDDTLEEGALKVTLIATGFEKKTSDSTIIEKKVIDINGQLPVTPASVTPVSSNPISNDPFILNQENQIALPVVDIVEEKPVVQERIVHVLYGAEEENVQEVVAEVKEECADFQPVNEAVDAFEPVIKRSTPEFSELKPVHEEVETYHHVEVSQPQEFLEPKIESIGIDRQAVEQRAEKLNRLTINLGALKDLQTLEAIESTPAYLRRNQALDIVPLSNERETSSSRLNMDDPNGSAFIKKDNSFLHDNAD